MANEFYTASGNPATGSQGLSALVRAEFLAIQHAFDLIPPFTVTGTYETIFNQHGNFTFDLPSAAGTIATTANVTTAVAVETARAEAAEASIAALVQFGGRNRLHNGAMEVAQRGASGSQNGTPGIDRWSAFSGAGTSWAQTSYAGWTSRRQWQVSATLAPARFIQMIQRIESARAYDLVGQQVTVQCQLYVSSTGSLSDTTCQVQLSAAGSPDNFGTGTFIQGIGFAAPGTPTVLEWTFSALPAAAANGFEIIFLFAQANTTQTINVVTTSVQLEPGTTASAFERDDPTTALIKCQRFFRPATMRLTGSQSAGGLVQYTYPLPVAMRASPTVVITADTSTNVSGNSISATASEIWNLGTATALGSFALNLALTLSAEL